MGVCAPVYLKYFLLIVYITFVIKVKSNCLKALLRSVSEQSLGGEVYPPWKRLVIPCARDTFRSLWCQKEAAGSHVESSGKGSYESPSLGKHFSLAFASPVCGSQAERGAGALPEPSSGDHPCRKAVSVGNPSGGGQAVQSPAQRLLPTPSPSAFQ